MKLSQLRRSPLWAACALSAMITGCASMAPVKPRVDPQFAKGAVQPRSIALLPIDISVHVAGKKPRPRLLDRKTMTRAVSALTSELQRKGYAVKALLRPDGSGVALRGEELGLVIHPDDLTALRVQIHRVTAAGRGPLIEAKVNTALARQVGARTDADASLYVRAWAYLAPDQGGAGRVVLQVLAGVFIAVVVVGMVALLFTKSGGKVFKGIAKLFGGVGKALGKAAVVAGRVAVRSLPYVARAYAAHRVICHSCRRDFAPRARCDEPGLMVATGPAPPIGSGREPVLRAGRPRRNRSTVGLAISLVANDSARVLWHADRAYELKITRGGSVEMLVRHFLKQLPRADRRPAKTAAQPAR